MVCIRCRLQRLPLPNYFCLFVAFQFFLALTGFQRQWGLFFTTRGCCEAVWFEWGCGVQVYSFSFRAWSFQGFGLGVWGLVVLVSRVFGMQFRAKPQTRNPPFPGVPKPPALLVLRTQERNWTSGWRKLFWAGFSDGIETLR